MKERHPEFVSRLEEHGVIYTKVMGEKDDPTSPVGRGWQSAFSTKDKSVAEERAAKLGMRLEWMDDGVKVIMGPIPAIRYDGARQRKIWFNSMLVAYRFPEDTQSNNAIVPVTFGNGLPLSAHAMGDIIKTLDEECVAIPWQKGDVMLLDNLAVLHSRRPLIKPPRRILASLCKWKEVNINSFQGPWFLIVWFN